MDKELEKTRDKPSRRGGSGGVRERSRGDAQTHRLQRLRDYSLKPPVAQSAEVRQSRRRNCLLECGWGRLIFANTFDSTGEIVDALREERPDCRDIAVYVRDPHVLLADAPQEVFLDPSHAFRLNLATWSSARRRSEGYFVRRLVSPADIEAINRLYAQRGMVAVAEDFLQANRHSRELVYLVVEDAQSGGVCGTVMGVDHHRAFADPQRGASLWCLAVDPQARHPGIGEALVRHLADYFVARGADWLDLTVMHDNTQAIALYEKLGFRRVPFFTAKRKNPINENLFTGTEPEAGLNPYAGIIVAEARRRGILVRIVDAPIGLFRLTHGGRSVLCRESLSELTSAVAMALCDDKRVTNRLVSAAGVTVAASITGDADDAGIEAFLEAHGEVVVKPARGEQGNGVSVGLSTLASVHAACEQARRFCADVLIEACMSGEDLRLVVIDFKVVAAAVRRPPMVVGDGTHTVQELIEHQSRRRRAATGGESSIPLDSDTERTVRDVGASLSDVLDKGRSLVVRKTANLHTGGTIHDVTGIVHPTLVQAAIRAARAIDIPVTGIDLMVRSVTGPDYIFIEANERPGLANHEPQPVAERFVDLLFPLSRSTATRRTTT